MPGVASLWFKSVSPSFCATTQIEIGYLPWWALPSPSAAPAAPLKRMRLPRRYFQSLAERAWEVAACLARGSAEIIERNCRLTPFLIKKHIVRIKQTCSPGQARTGDKYENRHLRTRNMGGPRGPFSL